LKDKAPAFQWYPKQYLGDDKVLAMDWDARGMHHWLLNISWQQEPPGSLPNDFDQIRRWLGSPSDDVWRRVRPQIFCSWSLRDGRWFNSGMVRAWERQQTYKQNGSKRRAKSELIAEEEEILDSKKKEPPKDWTGDDLAHHLLREIGIVPFGDLPVIVAKALELKANQPDWTPEKAFIHMLERATAAKSAKYRGNWINWFAGGDYDKPVTVWAEKKEKHKTESGQTIDRGYVPLRKPQ
jgi:hypothetical protein